MDIPIALYGHPILSFVDILLPFMDILLSFVDIILSSLDISFRPGARTSELEGRQHFKEGPNNLGGGGEQYTCTLKILHYMMVAQMVVGGDRETGVCTRGGASAWLLYAPDLPNGTD